MTATQRMRERLPDRRRSETFSIECSGLSYTATGSWLRDGRVAELLLNNYKNNSSVDTAARDSAIVFSIAIQSGADVETIRKALCRDSHGRASVPLGTAIDILSGDR
jgi:hypothetical protein